MSTQEKLLSTFVGEITEAKNRLSTLSNDFSRDQLETKPAPGKWSAIECIVHLNTTNGGYLRNANQAIESASESDASKNELKPRFLISKFINLMKPENKMKLKAPKVLMNNYTDNFEETISTFLQQQDQLIELAEKSKKYNLKKIKVTSPAISLLKFQLGEMLLVLVEHQKRHLLQAEKAVKNL